MGLCGLAVLEPRGGLLSMKICITYILSRILPTLLYIQSSSQNALQQVDNTIEHLDPMYKYYIWASNHKPQQISPTDLHKAQQISSQRPPPLLAVMDRSHYMSWPYQNDQQISLKPSKMISDDIPMEDLENIEGKGENKQQSDKEFKTIEVKDPEQLFMTEESDKCDCMSQDINGRLTEQKRSPEPAFPEFVHMNLENRRAFCRRFVFSQLCRGATSKRSDRNLPTFGTIHPLENYQQFLRDLDESQSKQKRGHLFSNILRKQKKGHLFSNILRKQKKGHIFNTVVREPDSTIGGNDPSVDTKHIRLMFSTILLRKRDFK